MLNVYEDNLEYLKDVCYDYEIEQVLDSLIIKNSYVYKFIDLIYDFDIDEYVLYDIVKIKGYDKPVYVYSVDCYDNELACLVQSFYIPHIVNDLDVHFVAFISNEIIEDELQYRYILGHELAHIDFLHLDKYEDHAFQERFHLIEAYCDIKSLDSIKDIKTEAYVNMMKEQEIDENMYNYFYSVKERLVRRRLLRLYMKGKLTVEMLYNYIIHNYDRHMKQYEQYVLEYSELLDKVPDIEFDNFEKRYRLDNYIDRKRYRDCI